ncbi:MAG TPA: hypothetical protein PLL10_08760, partial [Elusimicrobiales bacterium]|nr:hypothetical protein [Elusimicrobiales bacterium]
MENNTVIRDGQARFAKARELLLLAVIPAIIILFGLALRNARGPYFLASNMDPDYAYLVNSLDMATVGMVFHLDHPGTPVQALGAAVLKLAHPFLNEGELAKAVLSEPELYLRLLGSVFLCFSAAGCFVSGFLLLKSFGELWLAISAQLLPLAFAVNWGLGRVMPEPFLVAAAAVMCALLARGAESGRYSCAALGLTAGFGLACKLNFLPLFICPLFVLGPMGIARYAAYALVAWGVCTVPIVEHYHVLWAWALRLVFHGGPYGLEKTPFPPDFFSNVAGILSGTSWLWLLLAAWLV